MRVEKTASQVCTILRCLCPGQNPCFMTEGSRFIDASMYITLLQEIFGDLQHIRFPFSASQADREQESHVTKGNRGGTTGGRFSSFNRSKYLDRNGSEWSTLEGQIFHCKTIVVVSTPIKAGGFRIKDVCSEPLGASLGVILCVILRSGTNFSIHAVITPTYKLFTRKNRVGSNLPAICTGGRSQ